MSGGGGGGPPPSGRAEFIIRTMAGEVDRLFAAARSSLSSHLGEGNANDPYASSLLLCHSLILLTFATSTITGDLSQVDRLWSMVPTIYAWMCVIDTRTALMACLSTSWSIRLTYNFYRRGGYGKWPILWMGGEEDYRWGVLRSGMLGGRYWTMLTNGWIMMIFNFVFISTFQNYLLLYIASPSLYAWSMANATNMTTGDTTTSTSTSTSTLNVVDYVASALFVISLLGETIADNQQRAFQNGKREWLGRKNDTKGKVATTPTSSSSSIEREYEDGFCQSGLFAIVRKPAYAFEQLLWISYCLFSVAATVDGGGGGRSSSSYHCMNWSMGGCVSLCILFQASGWLTERISMTKYPAYRAYRERVPLYVPGIFSLARTIAGITMEDREKGE